MVFWSWLRGARPNTLKMKCFCLQTCKMRRYLCKVYVFNISKIGIFGKNERFSGNTPFNWNNTPRCSDHNWGGQGPIHYQAKGEKSASPGKWIFNTSKIGQIFQFLNWSKLTVLPGAKKQPKENQQNWFYIACKEQGLHFDRKLSKF